VLRHFPAFSEKQARQLIRTWLKNGVLRRESYYDEAERKDKIGLRVNNAKRPGGSAP
jgi:hypothetical protein